LLYFQDDQALKLSNNPFPPEGTKVMLGDLDNVSAIYFAASNLLISIYADP
jgi:hypothetical protein